MVWPILAWSGLYASHRLLYTAVHCVYCGRRCMFPLLPLLYFCSAAGRVRHSLFELERQHLSMMFQEAAAHVRQQHAVNAPQATTTASSFASQNELIQISNDIKAHLCCVFCVRCVFFFAVGSLVVAVHCVGNFVHIAPSPVCQVCKCECLDFSCSCLFSCCCCCSTFSMVILVS